MTTDERLEALLNRAGQTISDLPQKGTEVSEPYPLDACPKANGAAWDWYLDIGGNMDDYDSTRTKFVLKQYILHLTDVIDRMETALENVTGERDWMVAMAARIGFCYTCSHWNETADGCDLGDKCDPNSRETLLYTYAGVPEDWRADE